MTDARLHGDAEVSTEFARQEAKFPFFVLENYNIYNNVSKRLVNTFPISTCNIKIGFKLIDRYFPIEKRKSNVYKTWTNV